ncbi:MAG: metal-dependent hydrolase [Pseudomonadales bacterium]
MDPVTQGVLGASLPQAASNYVVTHEPGTKLRQLGTIGWLGCLSGMAPDLDILIQSPTDPILFLEYHRQFTHALIFIPVGALICAVIFHFFAKRGLTFGQTYIVCFLGYATHGLLDACTTYGTQLFWPFSDMRVAWNNVSVVDPLFTLPMAALVILTVIRRNPAFARAALIWGAIYLLFGVVQRERAEWAGFELARQQGHNPVRLEAKPGFGNLFLWKIVYETETEFHVDAVRLFFTPKTFPGDKIKKLNVVEDLPWLDPTSQQAKDLDRFDWFSNNYLALDKVRENYVIDIRYSMVPNEVDALWGIQLDPTLDREAHASYITNRTDSAKRLNDLVHLLMD